MAIAVVHHDVRCAVKELARVDFAARQGAGDAVVGINHVEKLIWVGRSMVHGADEEPGRVAGSVGDGVSNT
jgi:hypothetical protein